MSFGDDTLDPSNSRLKNWIGALRPEVEVGTSSQREIFADVVKERQRQHALKAAGRFRHTCDDPVLTDLNLFAILGEEVGEVGHEVNEAFDKEKAVNPHLRDELIQVLAVAMAWVERIDAQKV